MENCQVAVFLSYASRRGHALIDRELYVPKSWTADRARCCSAGIPEGTAFATKPRLARRMIGRALEAGTPAAWVTGDEAYGADPGLHADLERRPIGYVLAVAATHRITTAAGICQARQMAEYRCPAARGSGTRPGRAPKATAITTGPGSASIRGVPVPLAADPPQPPHPRTGVLPLPQPPPRPAGRPGQSRRDQVDHRREFQASKGLAGLDEHQVRRWGSWYRWTTLAMLALAFLTIAAATEHTRKTTPAGQIPLTRNEIAALFGSLVIRPVQDARHCLRWSAWRRHHQHRAKTCHYQRQARQL